MKGRNSKTILVVDDEPDILALVEMILKSAGYRVVKASNGLDALKATGRRVPDLIVLDMKMPVMDGWEFARSFRAEHGSETPIVVLSATADARKQAREIDAAGWLGKPFALDALVRLVGEQIGGP